MTERWVPLLMLLLMLGSTDGYLHVRMAYCDFNSTRPEDISYIKSYSYNKLEYVRFDSNVKWFVGYTEYGVKIAEDWNNDTYRLERARNDMYLFCFPFTILLYEKLFSKSEEPYAVIHTASSGGSERVLVCSVYGFFPKDITVTWTNNNQQITTGVINSETMPNRDWTYQLHSHLEYAPRSGDQISCVVEHVSLKEPMVLDYEGVLSDGERNKVVIGASGLVLGLVLSLAGFIYYRHKSRGLVLVPSH